MKTTSAILFALSLVPTVLNAQELEQIVVIGSSTNTTVSPADDLTFIEAVSPATPFTAGGYGGFAGYNERGTQIIHTSIFRNGVASNDAGSGWYDFGHDIVTGNESVKVVNGPNSVLYGSGSLGGTVFVNDTFNDQLVSRVGADHYFVNSTLLNKADNFGVSLTYFNASNGSVRVDNNEKDFYDNKTLKVLSKVGTFDLITSLTDYTYDYDDCFNTSWETSNNCVQKGQRYNFSLRNDHFTFGYNKNSVDFFTDGVETWASDADRYYADARNTSYLSDEVAVVYGVSFNNEHYANDSQTEYSGYTLLTYKDAVDVGVRVSNNTFVYRLGTNYNDFYATLGTSYRTPTLYERKGDAFVNSNNSLDPEQAFGFEVGYKTVAYFNYDFTQGIDYNFNDNMFVNTGKYKTQGVRFQDSFKFGNNKLDVYLAYTDSDQIRVGKYKTEIAYQRQFDDYSLSLKYAGQFDRGTDFNNVKIANISTLDFIAQKQLNNFNVEFSIQDLFDNRFEVLPGYGAGGRKFFLTFTYKQGKLF